MKKIRAIAFTALVLICIAVAFTGCGGSDVGNDSGTNKEEGGSTVNDGTYTVYLQTDKGRLEINTESNVFTAALKSDLQEGDITVEMSDYGGFEKVGSLPRIYPSDNRQITTEAGDVVLYSGNQLVIFYGSNTWSYTRMGRINATAQEIKEFLGSGGVTVKLSLK